MANIYQQSPVNAGDIIIDTLKTTTGYFTGGDGTLEGTSAYSGTLADANEKFYINVLQTHPNSASAATQFSIAYGHQQGSGSDAIGDTSTPDTLKSSTEAVYKQLSSILQGNVSASFKIAAGGTNVGGETIAAATTGERLGAEQQDKYVWAIIGKRARMKDRMNKKTWTLSLSGSNTAGTAGVIIKLTDDSNTVAATATPAGPRYNIVSGALGSVQEAASAKTYGWFYPDQGIMLFSGAQLSGSIPGYKKVGDGLAGVTGSFDARPAFRNAVITTNVSQSGFTPNVNNDGECGNNVKMLTCMRNMGSGVTLRLRGEEDLTQENYFCRVHANEYNFSNNPTFVSGGLNEIRHTTMRGNPTVYITGVGLYNEQSQLVATAKLSSPLKKNYVSEATIKVKLTY